MRRDEHGVGVVEVVLSLAILAVVASYAWPRYLDHRRRATVVEATANLEKIATGAQAYYAQMASSASGALPLLPPSSATWVPKVALHVRCAAGRSHYSVDLNKQFDQAPWSALGFSPQRALAYRYHWLVRQQASKQTRAQAVIYALGDLDCDGNVSRWRVLLSGGRAGLNRRGPDLVAGRRTD